MKKYITFSCIAACFFFVAAQGKASTNCSAVAGNLVANCGFETGDFTGWTLSGNDVPGELNNLYGVEAGADPTDNVSPLDGTYQAFFGDQIPNATTLSQSFATTSGDQYTITFWAAQSTATSGTELGECCNELLASFAGTTGLDQTDIAVEGYTKYSFTETATSGTSTLDLTLGDDLGYFQVDDVSVVNTTPVVTPEPESLWLFGTGLLTLVGAARRCLSSR
jgi:hypothetical protein